MFLPCAFCMRGITQQPVGQLWSMGLYSLMYQNGPLGSSGLMLWLKYWSIDKKKWADSTFSNQTWFANQKNLLGRRTETKERGAQRLHCLWVSVFSLNDQLCVNSVEFVWFKLKRLFIVITENVQSEFTH